MRYTSKYLLMAGVAVVTVMMTMTLGMDMAHAQTDFGTMAKTGVLFNQTGGAAALIKQASIILAAAFAVGGIAKLYANAKDGFKEGAKGFVVPGIMIIAAGLMFGMNALANGIVRKSTGTEVDAPITNTTGGTVTW